jgi:YD repeat-containing protein
VRLPQQATTSKIDGNTTTFGYDANGNRTGTGFAVNNLNQYTSFAAFGATYDANGNLSTYNGWTYTYDAQNRLDTVKQGYAVIECRKAVRHTQRSVRRPRDGQLDQA